MSLPSDENSIRYSLCENNSGRFWKREFCGVCLWLISLLRPCRNQSGLPCREAAQCDEMATELSHEALRRNGGRCGTCWGNRDPRSGPDISAEPWAPAKSFARLSRGTANTGFCRLASKWYILVPPPAVSREALGWYTLNFGWCQALLLPRIAWRFGGEAPAAERFFAQTSLVYITIW